MEHLIPRGRLRGMKHAKGLIPVVIVVLLLTVWSSACDRTRASVGSDDESYVAMAMHSSAGPPSGSSLFPSRAGTVKCMIDGGGPPPGIAVPGVCTTTVLVLGNEATVRFKESWNARSFYGGSARHDRLSHTWEIMLSKHAPGDHVTGARDYGDFPPQLVR